MKQIITDDFIIGYKPGDLVNIDDPGSAGKPFSRSFSDNKDIIFNGQAYTTRESHVYMNDVVVFNEFQFMCSKLNNEDKNLLNELFLIFKNVNPKGHLPRILKDDDNSAEFILLCDDDFLDFLNSNEKFINHRGSNGNISIGMGTLRKLALPYHYSTEGVFGTKVKNTYRINSKDFWNPDYLDLKQLNAELSAKTANLQLNSNYNFRVQNGIQFHELAHSVSNEEIFGDSFRRISLIGKDITNCWYKQSGLPEVLKSDSNLRKVVLNIERLTKVLSSLGESFSMIYEMTQGFDIDSLKDEDLKLEIFYIRLQQILKAFKNGKNGSLQLDKLVKGEPSGIDDHDIGTLILLTKGTLIISGTQDILDSEFNDHIIIDLIRDFNQSSKYFTVEEIRSMLNLIKMKIKHTLILLIQEFRSLNLNSDHFKKEHPDLDTSDIDFAKAVKWHCNEDNLESISKDLE